MKQVWIKSEGIALPGLLEVPASSRCMVVFAHGSGSSRHSKRNRQVAEYLNKAGIATLLFDLLTEAEADDRRNVFDVTLLAERLKIATAWLNGQELSADTAIGYFGASTGAAAALVAAADLGKAVAAVVSRGGRPDLALPRLAEVQVPTLLLVGSLDYQVLELNKLAAAHLRHRRLEIIPGATHLFEEPGTLELVCHHAAAWFTRYLS